MDQKSLQIRRSQWEQIVLEANKSAISKKDWCRQKGINLKSFYYWQKKIRNEAAKDMEEASNASLPVPAAPSAFVEIPFPSQSYRESEPSHALSPELMIQIGDCRVYVAGTIQDRTLDTVLKVLRNA